MAQSEYEIGEIVVVNFSWDEYRLTHKLRLAKIISSERKESEARFNGKTYTPVISEAIDIKTGKSYVEAPNGKTVFLKLELFEMQMHFIEENIKMQMNDFAKLQDDCREVL